MKIKNILALVCFLCIGVSCSMEDDILNDVDTKGSDTNIADTEAVFSISLSGNGPMTKAGEKEDPNIDTSTEASISNCFVAIIEGENVLSSYWFETADLQASSESFTTEIKRHMIVKVPSKNPPTLSAYAVANLSAETASRLLACKTLNGIKNVELAEPPTLLVKVGGQPIGAYKTTSQLATHDDANCNKVTIPVSQRAAAFELAFFKVVDASKEKVIGQYPEVKNVEVVSVQMLNIKQGAKVVGEYGDSFLDMTDIRKPSDVNPMDPDKAPYGTYDKIRFYGYDNTDANTLTSMKITYKVDGGAEMERTYPIKIDGVGAAGVEGGKLYKLNVTIGYASEEIRFVIDDWILNTLEVGDIYGEPVM